MKKQRKHYTPEEMVAILRRHLLDKEPISKLCDEVGLQPTVFNRWQKEFFENGGGGAETTADSSAEGRVKYEEAQSQCSADALGRWITSG